jgi:serine/threonine-protein kinase
MRLATVRLGQYELLLELASGGMGAVYVARQVGAGGFERLVAVKLLHPHLQAIHEYRDMLHDEAHLASVLRHPNVVPVIDVGEVDGGIFLVMEYVDSMSFAALVKRALDLGVRMPQRAVSRILIDSLTGLHAAHDAVDMHGRPLHVVHRDFSPQNIVVAVDGSSRLIDFGVAKARRRLTETQQGIVKGKYAYMSPEQAMGQPLDRRTDIFSGGILLWEALTGKRLFRAEDDTETLRLVLKGHIPRPSSVEPTVAPWLDTVVMRALARDRHARYQTAAEFAEALEAASTPAPARDVAALLHAYCGDRLNARKKKLHTILEGATERLAPARIPRVPPVGPRKATLTPHSSPPEVDTTGDEPTLTTSAAAHSHRRAIRLADESHSGPDLRQPLSRARA